MNSINSSEGEGLFLRIESQLLSQYSFDFLKILLGQTFHAANPIYQKCEVYTFF